MTYPNEALNAVVEMLMDDFELDLADVKLLAADLPGEFEAVEINRAEAAASMSWIDPAASIKAREWDMSRAIRDGDTVMAGFYRREIARLKAEFSK